MDRRGLEGANVVLIGAFDYRYPREKSLREGFELAGATIHECRYGESTTFPGPKKVLLLPYIYWTLARQLSGVGNRADGIDLLVVTKFNPLVIPLAAFYAWRLDALLVYDLFVSLHRTAKMRGIPWPAVKLTYLVERVTYPLPARLIVCTDQFVDLYAEMYEIPRDRFIRLPPGADEDRFFPRKAKKCDRFTALYWGNFLPHHGVEVIVDAAAQLDGIYDVEFVFLGTGPREEAAQRLAEEHTLSNVSFKGFVSEEDLHRWIAESHVCLGVFSDDTRALASITNKVCESVASGKATVTEDSPAVRDYFSHGEDIFVVPPEDPEALADAIVSLHDNPPLVERLEAGAYLVHQREFNTERIAELLSKAFQHESKA